MTVQPHTHQQTTYQHTTRLEHANITVPSIDAATEFLTIANQDWAIRKNAHNGQHRWAHIGNLECYIALQEPPHDHIPESLRDTYINLGINHLAMITINIEEVSRRLVEAGYTPNGGIASEANRKRMYFYDSAGFEWEFVEYFTDELEERYIYE
ncbi:glyoxalase [Vibrio sp.]|nr:glyoxalase [Vibrio sp.]